LFPELCQVKITRVILIKLKVIFDHRFSDFFYFLGFVHIPGDEIFKILIYIN